ncbi:MAG: MOSC domain-containing protein [Alphaproteobacteria bacterium]|nr:MOSC domain-containing protein [Alphaproteobacteria bacterium]
MTIDTAPKVVALYRYPVKGLSAQPLEQVTLTAGETIAFDRAWAIENGPGRFDPAAPKHLPKVAFVMLMRDERLAALEAEFDEASSTLTIKRDGRQVARGNLGTRLGCQMIEQFMAAYMKGSLRGPPKIVSAPGHSFSDVAAKCLHIVNMASVLELERVAGRTIDPLRFRPNVIIEGVPPWAEFDWIGKPLRCGDVILDVFDRTHRCAATDVAPGTGQRDMALPAILERTWKHGDFGVYAKVASGGNMAVGDELTPPPA